MPTPLFTEGNATSPDNFLDQLASFAAATAGFSHQQHGDVHYFTKLGMTYALRHFGTEVQLYLTPSPSFEAEWMPAALLQKPRYNSRCDFQSSGPFVKHWFFADENRQVVHAVIELSANVFVHLSFGQMDKAGSYTGGQYVTSSYYGTPRDIADQSLAKPFGGTANSDGGKHGGCVYNDLGFGDHRDFACFGDEIDGQLARGNGYGGIDHDMAMDEPSTIAMRAPLHPMKVFLFETNDNLYWPAGIVPGVCMMKITYLNPRDQLLNDEWRAFPLSEKNGNLTIAPNSHDWGLCYQQVTLP